MTTGHRAHTPVDAVVKVGGGLLAHPDALDAVLAAVAGAARARPLLVVPGGGPFADVVRAVDRQRALPEDAAHWMAILGMDQYAHLLAARCPHATLVRSRDEIAGALDAGRVPVLAPFAWLRAADPLRHSWDVTSDSLAAWIAGAVGAARLILVKPPGAPAGPEALDAAFAHALPAAVQPLVVAADRIDRLVSALRGGQDIG